MLHWEIIIIIIIIIIIVLKNNKISIYYQITMITMIINCNTFSDIIVIVVYCDNGQLCNMKSPPTHFTDMSSVSSKI